MRSSGGGREDVSEVTRRINVMLVVVMISVFVVASVVKALVAPVRTHLEWFGALVTLLMLSYTMTVIVSEIVETLMTARGVPLRLLMTALFGCFVLLVCSVLSMWYVVTT